MVTRGDPSLLASLQSPVIILNNLQDTNGETNQNKINSIIYPINNYNYKILDDYCFSFWYKMHNNIKELKVHLFENVSSSSTSSPSFSALSYENRLLLSRKGNFGNEWTLAETNLKKHQINGSMVRLNISLTDIKSLNYLKQIHFLKLNSTLGNCRC